MFLILFCYESTSPFLIWLRLNKKIIYYPKKPRLHKTFLQLQYAVVSIFAFSLIIIF